MFLNGNTCQENCPASYYPNSASFTCLPCTNNCSLCSSPTVCSACTNGTYLFNSSSACLTACPSGYVGIGALCQPCTNNCKTCTVGTNVCLTCVTGTYYLNSTQSCLAACPSGLFLDSLAQTCVGCSSACLTCANSASTCTSCNGTLLFNGQCLASCPAGMYSQTGTCLSCPLNCSSCSSPANCSGCSGTNFLYNGACVGSCPATSGFVISGTCTPCTAQNCFSCTSTNVCLSCKSNFLYFNAICLGSCTAGYTSNGTHCVSLLVQTLTDNSSPSSAFPVPFTIAGMVFIIACLMSRLQFPQTYLSGAVYSLIAVMEWGALCYFLYLYFIQYMAEPVAEYIGLGALAFLYVMNLTAWLAQSIFLCY